MTDPVADLLTRIRNASLAGHPACRVSSSRLKQDLLRILLEQGYVASVTGEGEGVRKDLVVKLKYRPDGSPAIQGIERVSRPGRRVFRSAADLPKVLGGLGLSIVSTSKGVLADVAARRMGVGGEVLCNVW